jgi:hypothetical protein
VADILQQMSLDPNTRIVQTSGSNTRTSDARAPNASPPAQQGVESATATTPAALSQNSPPVVSASSAAALPAHTSAPHNQGLPLPASAIHPTSPPQTSTQPPPPRASKLRPVPRSGHHELDGSELSRSELRREGRLRDWENERENERRDGEYGAYRLPGGEGGYRSCWSLGVVEKREAVGGGG